jgi:hypothetical protein
LQEEEEEGEEEEKEERLYSYSLILTFECTQMMYMMYLMKPKPEKNNPFLKTHPTKCSP